MSTKKQQKPYQRSVEMKKLVEEWRQSGQSQEPFSLSKGISPKTFNYWARKIRREEAAAGFVAVKIPDQRIAPVSAGVVFARLRLTDGVELSFEQEVSSNYLRSLLGW